MAVSPVQGGAVPRAWPLLGHFPAYGRDPLGFATRLANDVGGVVPVRFGPFPGLMITDPAAIEEVLVTKNRDFRKSPATRRVSVVTGNGILTSEGEDWREHRRVVQPAFHSERVRAWADVMVNEANSTVAAWHDGEVRDIHADMTALTLRIVVQTLLGSDFDSRDVEIVGAAATDLTDHFESRFNSARYFIPDFLPTPGNRRMRRAVRRLDSIIFRLIGQRRARPLGGDDVISMLLASRTEAGRPFTDREIRDEVMTLFMAGHETTALALTWSLYLLGQHPASANTLRTELSDAFGERPPRVEDLPRLRWTEAVINESLRLFPPAYAVSREAIRSTEVGGHKIGKRTVAFISVYAAHRNADRFPSPDEFRPERWLDGLAKQLPKGAFVPFAEGPRKCVGASFAMQEAGLVLATIASRVSLSPKSAHEVAVLPAVTLRPAEPVRMVVSSLP